MDTPLVSVLTTAYNREKFIAEAIESVLASTYTNFELIISDDFSTDRTVEIARSYAARDPRVKVYTNERNLGDYPNRNKAASYATGEYIKYLDSDDIMYKYGLEGFVDFMEKDKDVAIGISYMGYLSTRPFPLVLDPAQSLRHHFFTKEFLNMAPSGTIIRRRFFEAAGRFSGERMIGDYAFALKVATSYKVMLLPPGLFFWREHGDQEIVIAFNNNMYPTLKVEMLKSQFNGLSEKVLTNEEKRKIIRSHRRAERISHRKFFIQKLLGKKP